MKDHLSIDVQQNEEVNHVHIVFTPATTVEVDLVEHDYDD
jgi:hypothetical protein